MAKNISYQLANLVFALTLSAPIHAATETPFTLNNTVNTYTPEKSQDTKVGHQFWFIDKQTLDGRTLKMSVVGPGKSTHTAHSHAGDEIFFVLEGKAEFYLNGSTRIVGPYTSLYCPPNSQHHLRNVGENELKYLVIKKYKQKN